MHPRRLKDGTRHDAKLAIRADVRDSLRRGRDRQGRAPRIRWRSDFLAVRRSV